MKSILVPLLGMGTHTLIQAQQPRGEWSVGWPRAPLLKGERLTT